MAKVRTLAFTIKNTIVLVHQKTFALFLSTIDGKFATKNYNYTQPKINSIFKIHKKFIFFIINGYKIKTGQREKKIHS